MLNALREKNPFLSLLGIWKVPSTLRVLNAIPQAGDVDGHYAISPGVVRKELELSLVEGLSETDLQGYTDLLDLSSQKDKEVTGLKHMTEHGWEEIIPGVALSWGLQIDRPTLLQTGAVLAALRVFAVDPVIGAHKAIGRGEVSLYLHAETVEYDERFVPTTQPCGDVTVSRGTFAVQGDRLLEALEVFDQQAALGFPNLDLSVTPDEELLEGSA